MATDTCDRQTLIILGASGDLAARLLLPGLGQLLASPHGPDLLLIGSGVEDWTGEQWTARVTQSFAAAKADGDRVRQVVAQTRYLQADVTAVDDLQKLLAAVEGPVSIFFALPPAVTAKACRALCSVGLPRSTRLVLEKPFGIDAGSAAALNELLAQLVPENNIFRVDHFLGKSTVLNLLGLRFANRMFEPVMTNQNVEKIEIIFDEDLALEGRARYYDGAGALVDMIQSHLLQVMALLTMDPPASLSAPDIRDHKAEILRATRLWGDPSTASRRARYTAGSISGRDVPGYAESEGVDPQRGTETLAEVSVEVNTWRWVGVPITLRSGKALSQVRKEAIVTLLPAPRIPDGFRGQAVAEQLRLGMSDPASMSLGVNINGPGDPLVLDSVNLDVQLSDGDLKPYGEVLRGVLDGDPMLSVRADSAVDGWRIIEPVLRAWRSGAVPLQEYPAGSSGPAEWAPVGERAACIFGGQPPT